jgi:2-hydroxychromene-2-carboxylate isomerase
MAGRFEFFFDYVSPTAYLALPVAQGVAARTGAQLVWRPMFLGGVMQGSGNKPPGTVPAKAKYMNRDLQRCAAHIGLPLHMNPAFPMNTLGLVRATIGLESRPAEMARFIEAAFRHCWGKPDPMNPAAAGAVEAFCAAEGFDADEILALGKSEENKEKLKANTEEALSRGVFGAPSFFVGDDLFFGHDRLDYVERALKA